MTYRSPQTGVPILAGLWTMRMVSPFVKEYQRRCQATTTQTGPFASRRADQRTVPCCFTDSTGSSSTTQNVVALSSGEKRVLRTLETCSPLLGLQALACVLVAHSLHRYSWTALRARETASRRGVGKVRHLHVLVLWLQSAVQEKRITLHKVPGYGKLAPLLHKAYDGADVAPVYHSSKDNRPSRHNMT